MTAGQVIATILIVAQIYLISPQQMDCMVYRESSYKVAAVNGVHLGLAQYRPDSFDWFVVMALEDPLFMHAEVVRANPDPRDPIVSLLIMAWCLRNGYGDHWSTWEMCKEGRIP